MDMCMIIKQASKLSFGRSSFCRFFDMTEDAFQGLVQVLIRGCPSSDIAEKLTAQDEESLFLDKAFPGFLGISI